MVKRYTDELDRYNVCEWSLCGSERAHLSSTETGKSLAFIILINQKSIKVYNWILYFW